MRSTHVYASVDLLKEYLAGDGHTSEWTEDISVLRRLLESASLSIEQHVGDRCFGSFLATREYDLGTGQLRRNAAMPGHAQLIDGIAGTASRGVIPLGDWLSGIPTTVTAYDGTARGSNTVLTEGLANDYLLEPDHQAPYDTLKLSENTSNGLSAGQRTLSILADWGFAADVELTNNAVNDGSNINATQTTITYDGSGSISAGEILLLESEQVYVVSKTTTVLTVRRAQNGTTGATHADDTATSRYLYPSDVSEACLSISRDRYRSREAGTTAILGAPGAPFPRPGAEMRAILKGLNYYMKRRENAGVFF